MMFALAGGEGYPQQQARVLRVRECDSDKKGGSKNPNILQTSYAHAPLQKEAFEST